MHPQASSFALVGRETELQRVDRLVQEALAGHGVLLLLSGESGVGKTALATEIAQRAQARGACAAFGRCYQTNGMPPFSPWQDLLVELDSAAIPIVQLPPPFGAAPTSRTAYELLHAVARGLLQASHERPLVLCLEDVHWADRDTLELLWFVSRELRAAPVVVIATFRVEEVLRDHQLSPMLSRLQHDCPTEQFHIARLSPSETGQLVESRAGAASPELVAQLHARSEGNPFYIVELLRDLQDRHLLRMDPTGQLLPPQGELGVPHLLRHVILQRVARLGPDGEALLTAAAVVGHEWELDLVETVLGWDEARLLKVLEAALASQMIVIVGDSPEAYRFGHALVREALYGQLTIRRRRQLHRQVGVALEGLLTHGRDAALYPALAAQFTAAQDWPRALHYAKHAGDWSRARHATHSALYSYELGRDAVAHLDTDERQRDVYDIAMSQSIAELHMLLNQLDHAEREFNRVVHLARRTADRSAEAEALAWQSAICARMNRMGEAVETADVALSVASGVAELRVRALAHRSVAHMQLVNGNLESGLAEAARGAQLAREGPATDVLGSCLYDLALTATWRGDYGHAEKLAEEALRLADQDHNVLLLTSVCFCLGVLRTERGRYLAARQALQVGLETATAAGERRNVAKLMNTLGALYDELFDFDMADEWNQRGLKAARMASDVSVLEAERYSLLNLATTALHREDIEEAARYLEELAPKLDTTEYSRFRYLNRYQLARAEVCLASRDMAQAQRWAEEARALAMSKGVQKNIAKSYFLSGRAMSAQGRVTQAVEDLQRGLAIADALQHASLSWVGRLWLGQALESHRVSEAREVYLEASNAIDGIAAGLVADQRLHHQFTSSAPVKAVRSALAEGRAAARPSNPAGLTTRELDVLRLVSVGLTNAHIARVLSISPRTVDVHMTSILSKTGSANRAAAAAFALRHGIGQVQVGETSYPATS